MSEAKLESIFREFEQISATWWMAPSNGLLMIDSCLVEGEREYVGDRIGADQAHH